jgi:LPXTG-site transpeptidase (sortase) family protein
MKKKIIYQKGDAFSGEVFIFREDTVSLWRHYLGRFLTIGGLTAALIFVGPLLLAEAKWQFSQLKSRAVFLAPKESKFAQVIKISNLRMLKPADAEFSLVIPKIGVNSVVLAEIPVDDKKIYQEALKDGIVHAKGSYLPDQNGTVYLFGHSSNYIWNWGNSLAVFYLLNKLEAGDQLNLFYQDERFVYQVSEKSVVKPGELSFLKPRQGKEKLILQTCWPLGSNWKRLVVSAEKV